MKKIVTYYGGKQQIYLPLNNSAVIFNYGETKELDLPSDVVLSSDFIVEEIAKKEPQYLDSNVLTIKSRKKNNRR